MPRDIYHRGSNKIKKLMKSACLFLPMTDATHDPSNNRTLDVSGNGNHCIFANGYTSSKFPTKLGDSRGYSLDGNDYFTTPSCNPFSYGAGEAFSVFMALKWNSGSVIELFGHGSGGNVNAECYYLASNNTIRIRGGSPAPEAYLSNALSSGDVTSFSYSINDTDCQMNKDGVASGGTQNITAPDKTAQIEYIGALPTNYFLVGNIYAFGVFPYVLNASQNKLLHDYFTKGIS